MKPEQILLIGALLFAMSSAAGAGEHVVIQKDKAFAPSEISIAAGDQVLFKNDDTVTHNVFSKSPGATFNLKAQKPGETSPIAFTSPGTHDIRCAIHPNMKLTVNVK